MHTSTLLAQYNGGEGGGAVSFLGIAIYSAILVFYLATGWQLFSKAGRPGWAILIPIYNLIVFIQISGRPAWWILLYLIPIVNFVVSILLIVDLCRKFGKGIGFAVLTVFFGFVTFPILAFGDAEYHPEA